jgi:hypothetical protein
MSKTYLKLPKDIRGKAEVNQRVNCWIYDIWWWRLESKHSDGLFPLLVEYKVKKKSEKLEIY